MKKLLFILALITLYQALEFTVSCTEKNNPVVDVQNMPSGKYNGVIIGAESYFFEEGQAELFEKACYGGLMVDKNGNSILIGLYDENFEKIKK